MTGTEAQNLREDYLSRLDAAIAELPWRVANELRSGIAEELDGLGAAEVRERIAQLGDPVRIAEAAREESASAPPAPVVVVAPAPASLPTFGAKPAIVDTKWFAIVGALVLGFGSFVFPIGGWVIGVALVTSSRFWRRWEKAVAVLLPFVAWVLMFFLSALLRGLSVWSPSDSRNPLLPAAYDLANVAFVLMILIPASTFWLLWRLRGRDAPLR
ncbi:HAAS signaling domain-containing protein [Microbacterium sp. NPDC089698]|uniref:HAAS signaling domain-containing protein n=1 Tax=Microbacterium sp. NPDC089698 TaxID=3364200 RepID=UPI003825ABB9